MMIPYKIWMITILSVSKILYSAPLVKYVFQRMESVIWNDISESMKKKKSSRKKQVFYLKRMKSHSSVRKTMHES